MAYFQVNKKPILTFPTLTGSIVTFNSQYAGLPLKSHTVDIDSVSGVSGITIAATSDNLADFNDVVNNRYYKNDNTIGSSNAWKRVNNYVPVPPDADLYFDYDNMPSTTTNVVNVFYDENKNVIDNVLATNKSIHTPVNCHYMRFSIYTMGTDFELNIGLSGLPYSAYNGTSKTISIGQTVNEATYNARTGVLEVTQPSVQTIQLPPCPIDTLLVNNIWADTGDTTLQYPKFG